jgi:hypothetical protein
MDGFRRDSSFKGLITYFNSNRSSLQLMNRETASCKTVADSPLLQSRLECKGKLPRHRWSVVKVACVPHGPHFQLCRPEYKLHHNENIVVSSNTSFGLYNYFLEKKNMWVKFLGQVRYVSE